MIAITPAEARRLAITRQRLAGPRPAPDAAGLLETFRDLGCVQLDPISAVEKSHRLVLWSRVGGYDRADLDALLWHERRLFEYWAHAASIVLTEDYPIHSLRMRRDPGHGTGWAERVGEWIRQNDRLRRHILARLRRAGPLPSRLLEEDGLEPKAWVSSGWTSGRNVSRMLDFLHMQGRSLVARREGGQKLWDLAERCLPDWTPRDRLPEREVVRRAAQRSLRALGVATPRHIEQHFISGRYPRLPAVLAGLERAGRIARVEIRERPGAPAWPGEWYVHADDLSLLERLRAGHDWAPRTVLLSPFDNLSRDRQRTRQLFGFDYTIEIYVPQARRQYGYYVLPILHGDRLIGRVDPQMDRAAGRLNVNAIYAEPGPNGQGGAQAGAAVGAALRDLASFLGAREVCYNRQRTPAAWRRALAD
jgi:uncharacterized protein YcaQ